MVLSVIIFYLFEDSCVYTCLYIHTHIGFWYASASNSCLRSTPILQSTSTLSKPMPTLRQLGAHDKQPPTYLVPSLSPPSQKPESCISTILLNTKLTTEGKTSVDHPAPMFQLFGVPCPSTDQCTFIDSLMVSV